MTFWRRKEKPALISDPLVKVHCSITSSDTMLVRTARSGAMHRVVLQASTAEHDDIIVALDPGNARAFAAAVLNAADEVDGVEPLVFMPDCEREHK